MADLERTVLEFYQVSTAYPEVWPTDKGNSDDSEDEEDKQRKQKLARRKSRYQALERQTTNRSAQTPGGEKGNLVQRDEPDPLGTTDSVVMTLKRSGVPIDDDPRLRKHTKLLVEVLCGLTAVQAAGFSFPRRPSHPLSSCRRCTQRPIHSLC